MKYMGKGAWVEPRDLTLPMLTRLRPMREGYERATLQVCINDRSRHDAVSCAPRGALRIHELLVAAIADAGLDIELRTVHCLGTCQRGPSVRLSPGDSWFWGVHAEDVPVLIELIARLLAGEQPPDGDDDDDGATQTPAPESR
jgi:(2Fe-2S) ferredoxin